MSNNFLGAPLLKKIIKYKKKFKINFIVTSKQKKNNIIKKIALKNKINIIDSKNINNYNYIKKKINKKNDLFILISFKILKKKIWEIPQKGTLNIHPSLLPEYKGPCPINWVIINNEKYTGLTSFWINNKIDNGKIILQKKIKIKKNINFKNLYKQLSFLIPNFFLKTIKNIYKKKNYYAPKIDNFYSKINFNLNYIKILKLILGLSYKKPAWCFLNTKNNILIINIYKIKIINKKKFREKKNGELFKYKKKIFLKLKKKIIELLICKIENKKKMKMFDIYNGLQEKEFIFLF
ncbi:MAG: hypothetical protein NHG09_00045 [Candidatus Shikimatogenerans sp. JK-2022]|nr:hypothetical protein [Candidatus Shikimatogenerans bostrichidophilus]